jgi:four helix bundle protein
MTAWSDQLKTRTQRFAVDVIKFVRLRVALPELADVKLQLVNAATGAADNYRSACRGRSHAEFTARLGVALDEIDEAESWLAILEDLGVGRGAELDRLRREAKELRAVFVAATITARRNQRARETARRPQPEP